jgi:hypothetical protein
VGPLGGKCGTVGWKGRGVVLANRHLQGCSPCLCRLRTDGLASVSKYWTYRSHVGDIGPVNLVACCRQMFDFYYYFNDCVRRENGWRTCGLLSRAGFVLGAIFLRSSRAHPTLLMTCRRLSRTGTIRRKHTPSVRGLTWEAYVSCWSNFLLQGVHRFESLRLSDMSNRLFMLVFT